MSGTLNGHSCAYCGSWVGPTDIHWCEKMHPNWTPEWTATRIDPNSPGGPLDRIADALQRIADALEVSNQERSPASGSDLRVGSESPADAPSPGVTAQKGGEVPTPELNWDETVAKEFPQLWALAKDYDDAVNKLGASATKLSEEADRAMREIWDARGAFRG